MKLALVSLNNQDPGNVAPVGLAALATYVRDKVKSDWEVRVIDINFHDIIEEIKSWKPDLIGMTSMTIDYMAAVKYASNLKKIFNIPIFIGGVHISTLPESLKPCFDFGVVGEGEETLVEVLEHYNKKGNIENLEKIRGLVFFKNGKLVYTLKREPIRDLNSIPITDRSFLNENYFKKRILPSGVYGLKATMLTSRGCPYKCGFCSTTQFWETVRFRSVDHVVKEIKECIEKYGVKHITFHDDLFTVNKRRLSEMADRFEKEGFDLTFFCQGRTNLMDDEMCQLLKRIGVIKIGFGFESGSDRMIRYLKKGSASIETHKKAVLNCKKYGFKIDGSLIFGSPTETLEDMKETLKFIDFLILNNANNIWSFVMTPFPGTSLWQLALDRGVVSNNMDFDKLTHQALDEPLLLEKDISLDEFKKIFNKGRNKLKHFRFVKVKHDLKHHPFIVIKKALLKPGRTIKVLMNKQDM